MTGEKGGLLAALRAEALKSRHAAPVRLAVLMALPMPLLGAMPYRGVQIFSAWNYWYALFLPVSLSLVVACVARADARTRMRGLLGLGFPLGRAWWAKALWCLALCTLSNLVVFGIYLAGSAFSSQGLTAAGTLTMLLCALANTVTAAWMIPAGLFLTARLGMLAGIFCPLDKQLVGGFAWSLMPLPQLFPPSASMVIPTSFIPVLPSGEPLAADMALGGALTADGVAEQIVKLLDAANGHALGLFTSYAAISAVRERLKQRDLPYPVLTLGRNGGHTMSEFMAHPGSVLLAAGAAWEGFDFPGDCVSLLILPRLPFPMPDAVKEQERMKHATLHDFLRAVVVPEMQIKLRQGFGRAIRTETDTCVVAILDERAGKNRRYFRDVLTALPEVPVTHSLKDVERFIRAVKPEGYFLEGAA